MNELFVFMPENNARVAVISTDTAYLRRTGGPSHKKLTISLTADWLNLFKMCMYQFFFRCELAD